MVIHILLWSLLLWVLWRTAFWYREGFRMQKAGYLPPPPTWLGKLSYKIICRLGMRALCGPVIVIGRENALKYKGRLLIGPNHQHGLDFAGVRYAMPTSFRQIGAAKEMKGYRAGPSAYWGSFAVPVNGGKATSDPRPAMEACVKVLSLQSDSKLLMFPQGKLVWDNILRDEDFRTGWYRVLKMVAENTGGQPLAVLPMAIHYHTDASKASFIRRKLVYPLWRRLFAEYNSEPKFGATIVIGEPIEFKDLPADARQATQVLRAKIQALLDQAKAATDAA